MLDLCYCEVKASYKNDKSRDAILAAVKKNPEGDNDVLDLSIFAPPPPQPEDGSPDTFDYGKWKIRHWGTDRLPVIESCEVRGSDILLGLFCAWSPALAGLAHIVKAFPDVSIEVFFFEMNDDYRAKVVIAADGVLFWEGAFFPPVITEDFDLYGDPPKDFPGIEPKTFPGPQSFIDYEGAHRTEAIRLAMLSEDNGDKPGQG